MSRPKEHRISAAQLSEALCDSSRVEFRKV